MDNKLTPAQRKRAQREAATPSYTSQPEVPLSREEWNREMARREQEAMAGLRAQGANPVHVLLMPPGTPCIRYSRKKDTD